MLFFIEAVSVKFLYTLILRKLRFFFLAQFILGGKCYDYVHSRMSLLTTNIA